MVLNKKNGIENYLDTQKIFLKYFLKKEFHWTSVVHEVPYDIYKHLEKTNIKTNYYYHDKI